MAKHEKKKNNKKMSFKGILLIILMIFIMFIAGVSSYLYWSFKNNSHIENNYINKSDESNYNEVEGVSNILLIGNDARNFNEKARSDAILILSIDNINKNLKLISIMRDSYVEIPGYGEQKINHALAYGGAELLKDTIEKNFNLKLHDYGIINFQGFQELIDCIGGLDVKVTEIERKEMNKFIPEVNVKNPHLVAKSGFQHLDGQQVLSYSRIRKIGKGDYDRTERQREVISLIIDKLKDTNILKYPMLASKLFPYVKTNMDVSEILNYAYTIFKIGNFTPQQMLIPVPELTEPRIVNGKGWVVLMDKEQNAQIMHDFIFNNERYNAKSLDYESYKMAMEKYKKEIKTYTKPTNNLDEYDNDKECLDVYESNIKINKNDIGNRVNKPKNRINKPKINYKNKVKQNSKTKQKNKYNKNSHNDKSQRNNNNKNNNKNNELQNLQKHKATEEDKKDIEKVDTQYNGNIKKQDDRENKLK